MTEKFVTLPREVVEQALDAFVKLQADDDVGLASWDFAEAGDACFALRAALDQTQESPYGECDECGTEYSFDPTDGGSICVACLKERLKQPQCEQEPVGYEYVEHRPYGAPGEIRRGTILLEHYRNADGAIAGDWEWLVQQFKTSKNTISMRPLYTQPQPKREPLTDEEIDKLCPQFDDPMRREMWIIGFKAAHNIK